VRHLEKQSEDFSAKTRDESRAGGTPAVLLPTNEKAADRRPASSPLIFLEKTGAGERIRTVDPNLGKVMLYP
jgi:hypothetical protein